MKYELIKKYPGSPDLGFIASTKSDNAYYVNSNWIQPENYPEFWIKVIEKDYEILRSCPIEGSIYSVKRISDGVGLNFTIADLKDSDYIFFAKKENAEKYIQDNKPKRLYTEDEMVRAL